METKLKVRNTKEVTFTRSYFVGLIKLATNAINVMASWKPATNDTKELRSTLEPVYHWLALQLSDIYGLTVEQALLHGLHFTLIDPINSVVEVKVSYTRERVTRSFTLRCNDETAPYTTKWAECLNKVGGAGNHFAQKLGCV